MILEGKKILITGIVNRHSIAFSTNGSSTQSIVRAFIAFRLRYRCFRRSCEAT